MAFVCENRSQNTAAMVRKCPGVTHLRSSARMAEKQFEKLKESVLPIGPP